MEQAKAITYAALVVMYLDSSDYVRSFHVNGPTPVGHACFQLMGLHEQLGESMRARYDRFLSLAQRTQSSWSDFDATVAGLVAHIERHGQAPVLDNNVWTDDHGRRHYLGDGPEVYLALGRRRAGEGA